SFLFYLCRVIVHLDLLSFPTRRSSDLRGAPERAAAGDAPPVPARGRERVVAVPHGRGGRLRVRRVGVRQRGAAGVARAGGDGGRSEEHTSELQSRENLVCRLLLEKKNI